MAKRKKIPKITPEEQERWDKNSRMIKERIAYHEAKAQEEEEREAAQRQGREG